MVGAGASAQPPRHSCERRGVAGPGEGHGDVGRAVAGRGVGRAGQVEDQAAEPGTDVGGVPVVEVGEEVLELAEVAELVQPGVGAGGPGRREAPAPSPSCSSATLGSSSARTTPSSLAAWKSRTATGSRQLVSTRACRPLAKTRSTSAWVSTGTSGSPSRRARTRSTRSVPSGPASARSNDDGQRMGAQVEQDPAAPTLGEEVPPAGPALEHAGVDVAERSEPAHERGRPQHDGGEGQVLGIAGPVPGGLVGGHELVGGPQRGGEGLLDDRRGAGGQRGERVGHVAGGRESTTTTTSASPGSSSYRQATAPSWPARSAACSGPSRRDSADRDAGERSARPGRGRRRCVLRRRSPAGSRSAGGDGGAGRCHQRPAMRATTGANTSRPSAWTTK